MVSPSSAGVCVQSPDHHRVDLTSPGAVTSVAAEVWGPASGGGGPVLLLAHGAGSRVDHPVHRGVAAAVAATGHPVVAFNFAYSEAGRRSPDLARRLLDCYRDVADWAGSQFPHRPLVGGGRSMGGRMASLLAAEGYPLAGLVLLNYPLVASRGGGSGAPRTQHWPSLSVPVLFVHGSRDRLFPSDVFSASRDLLQVPTTVHVVDDADHVFGVPKRAGRDASQVYSEVGEVVGRWLADVAVAA